MFHGASATLSQFAGLQETKHESSLLFVSDLHSQATYAVQPFRHCLGMQVDGGKKPAWYRRLLTLQPSRPSSTRASTTTGTGPTESGTSGTLDSNQSSLQLTGSKATILSSTLRTHVPKSVEREILPILATQGFDSLRW